jgi:hypothetical protein
MKKLKVLVACEESQAVTKEFRKLGHEAYSCDILPCSGGHPEWHIQGDAVEVLYSEKWDLVIAHPPCTRLANSGVRWLKERDLWNDLKDACEFFNEFKKYGESGSLIAIENPIPHKYATHGFLQEEKHVEGIGNYTQIIQPYEFGHLEKKATCLWLFGLPELKETNNVHKEMMQLPYSERAKIHRAKLRSKTYTGIAKAMAEQWSEYLTNPSPDSTEVEILKGRL